MERNLEDFLAQRGAVARICLTDVRGSSPRAAGTEMFVTQTQTYGTIGGGQLEYMAIDHARAMLARGDKQADMDVPLGPEIGQCCGGRVQLSVARMTPAAKTKAVNTERAAQDARASVFIFGAGHVGRALAAGLSLLPVKTVLIDSRAEELALGTDQVEKRLSPLPEAEVRHAPPNSAFVVLTHDHSLDFLVASEALARRDAAYVGMIGSITKRARLKSWCAAQMPDLDTRALICPIGANSSGDKRPAVIAAFVAAEVMAALSVPALSPITAPFVRTPQ